MTNNQNDPAPLNEAMLPGPRFDFSSITESVQATPIDKEARYLSPSSFKQWRACPFKYYLTRMSPCRGELEKDPQGKPAAIGHGFEAFVAAYIQQKMGLDSNPYNLINRNVIDPPLQEEAAVAGLALFKIYFETALETLLNESPAHFGRVVGWETEDSTKPRRDWERGGIDVYGVPIFGYIDLELESGYIIDFKTKGYASAPKSPTQGYLRRWKKGKLESKPHKKFAEPYDSIHEDWALAACFYAFGRGHIPGEELKVGWEEVSMRNVRCPEDITHKSVSVTQTRTYISKEFQLQILLEMQEAWRMISSGEIPEAAPNKRTCIRFRRLCEAAPHCERFQSQKEWILRKKGEPGGFVKSAKDVLKKIRTFTGPQSEKHFDV